MWPAGVLAGDPLVSVGCLSNLTITDGWESFSYEFTPDDLAAVAGEMTGLWFSMTTDELSPTSAYVDAVSLEVCRGSE